MSDFFESEIVREELDEINKMQQEIYSDLASFGNLSPEDKKEHIEKMIGQKSKETVAEIYHSLEGIKLVQTNNLQFGIDFNDFDDPEECMRLSQEFMKTMIDNISPHDSIRLLKSLLHRKALLPVQPKEPPGCLAWKCPIHLVRQDGWHKMQESPRLHL